MGRPVRDAIIAELSHQLRDILALAEAMVGQGKPASGPGAEARVALAARLVTLEGAHRFLVTGIAERVGLRRTVEAVLGPHGLDARPVRVLVRGPPARLDPRRALCLSMTLNELATHATEHGALGAATGRVEVTWRLADAAGIRRIRLLWREHGGPPVRQAPREFGLGLIHRRMALGPGEGAHVRVHPDGLSCRLDLLAAPPERRSARPRGA